MPQPQRAHRIVVHAAAGRQVVQDERPARREQADELLVLLRPAAVGEEQVERRLGRQQLAPVAVDDTRVRILGRSSAAAAARSSSSSTVTKGTSGASPGEDPGRADPAARADLRDPRAPALRREDVQQPARLLAARPLEADPRGQRERSLDERRDHVPRLAPCPSRSRCRRTSTRPGRRGLAGRLRGAVRGCRRAGARSTGSPAPRTTASASRSWSSTSRTRSARRASSSSSPAAPGTGALDDSRRLCEFVYRNLGSITQVFPTLDTHDALQIFHPALIADAEGRHPRAVHARHRGGRRRGTLADRRRRRRRARARRGLRAGASALLHAGARAGRQVQPHDLAVPRAARRDRLRARLGRRGGGLLPHDRAASRRPSSSRRATTRSPSTTRCSGPRWRSTRRASRSAGATSR